MKKKVVLLVLGFIVILGFVINVPMQSLDELWNYSFSKNIANGLVPYKDFNLVQTPLLFFITAIFLKFVFNGIIMTRILGAILTILILVMMYLVLNKLLKNKYIIYFVLISILFLLMSYICLDYNWLVLLFGLILLNYELKFKNENLLKLNIKQDFLIGIVAGLAILTKQSAGLCLAVVYVGYKWVAIRSKEDFIIAFKISLSRGLGVLVPIGVFLAYSLFTNSFSDFINFCILGVSEFSNSVPYYNLIFPGNYDNNFVILSLMVILIIIYSIFYLVKNWKLNTLENKNILKIFAFGMASFVVVFPISDPIHFLNGGIPLILLGIYIIGTHIDLKNKTFIDKMFIYLVYIFCVVLLIASGYSYYKYFNDDRKCDINHYKYLLMNPYTVQAIEGVNNWIDSKEKESKKVYILNADAVLYNIVADRYNKYFDLLLKGNLGENGVNTVIDIIENSDENSIFLILNDKYAPNWQFPKEISKYIKDNFENAGTLVSFNVYWR